MAQISFSFNGGFCPVNLPLFHGTRPGVLIAVVSMTFSFRMKGTLVCAGCRLPAAGGRCPTHNGPPTFPRGDLQARVLDVLLHADSGRMRQKHRA
ncbi:hypothetical protein, partial [Caballeronia sp.]|uniref:hypothetical protein n=1 Tax=Caballeronia sp. TaxID=1931223 RepID=UPI003C3E7752